MLNELTEYITYRMNVVCNSTLEPKKSIDITQFNKQIKTMDAT